MGKIPQFTTCQYYISLFYHILSQKRLVFSQPLENIERFFAIEAAFSHNFVHIFSTRFDFPKKGPFFPKNRGFFGKCWESDCAAPRPLLPLHRQFEARVAHDGKLTK